MKLKNNCVSILTAKSLPVVQNVHGMTLACHYNDKNRSGALTNCPAMDKKIFWKMKNCPSMDS